MSKDCEIIALSEWLTAEFDGRLRCKLTNGAGKSVEFDAIIRAYTPNVECPAFDIELCSSGKPTTVGGPLDA